MTDRSSTVPTDDQPPTMRARWIDGRRTFWIERPGDLPLRAETIGDTSGRHDISESYDPACSHCWLHQPHTVDRHRGKVRRAAASQ